MSEQLPARTLAQIVDIQREQIDGLKRYIAEIERGKTEALDLAAGLEARIAELEADNQRLRGQSLLRKVGEPLPEGCYCAPGKCAAPRPNWCRDFNKRDALLGGGENGI